MTKSTSYSTYAKPISCGNKQDLLVSFEGRILYHLVKEKYFGLVWQLQGPSPWIQTQDANSLYVGMHQSIQQCLDLWALLAA